MSPEATDFIIRCLQRDPSQRLGAGEHGCEELRFHGWFKEIDFKKLILKQYTLPYVPNLAGNLFNLTNFN